MPYLPMGRAARVDRFVGWLTIAIGAATFSPLLPAGGLGRMLEATGERVFIGSLSVAAGALQILSTYWGTCSRCRIFVIITSMGVWFVLMLRFYEAGLYGGMLQAIVIMMFAGGSVYRMTGEGYDDVRP